MIDLTDRNPSIDLLQVEFYITDPRVGRSTNANQCLLLRLLV